MKKMPAMPFKVDHALWGNIETQVTDGIRMAILSGYYKPGDILPSLVAFARGLGVSTRAPQTALRVLTQEGLVSPRTRRGTMVLGPRLGAFRGRVVIVQRDSLPIYYNSMIESRLCDRLTGAGYLVTRISVRLVSGRQEDATLERYDVRQLIATLRQSTLLAIVIGSSTHLEATLSESGTPYVSVGLTRPTATGCAGFALQTMSGAIPGLLARLRERGMRRLVQVALRPSECIDPAIFQDFCESVDGISIWPGTEEVVPQDQLVRLAFDTFANRYHTKADLPDAFVFTNDYLARGALTALLAAGIRTGRDVLVATLANSGIMPVHPDPIDLMWRDPSRDADVVSDAVLSYLDTGAFPQDLTLATEFIPAKQ
ncbi:MAG: GntR family transcriptional regulator [Kiritimatiellae bacterium]|nr:GntR family transcriptional regulator [Kiritimatiellia bacterium]